MLLQVIVVPDLSACLFCPDALRPLPAFWQVRRDHPEVRSLLFLCREALVGGQQLPPLHTELPSCVAESIYILLQVP